MKPRMSSLNPYAASYIPLYWREENKKSKMSELTAEGSLKSAHKNNDSYSPSEFHGKIDLDFSRADAASDFNISGITRKDKLNLSYDSKKQNIDEDAEIDLAYLATLFPNMSEQSLAFAYSVSGGDTEASIDMLNELESNPADDSKYLPDSLDIGDVPECKVTAACSSSKLSFLSDEASGTSSGPSGSAT